MEIKSVDDILKFASDCPSARMAVAAPEDDASLEAVKTAVERGIVTAVFTGCRHKIEAAMKRLGMTFENIDIVDADGYEDASSKAVSLVKNGDAQLLMKGTVHTDQILRAVLDKNNGLRTGALLSHALIFNHEKLSKPVVLTDAAMNVAPDLSQKVGILKNAAHLMKVVFGKETCKAAILAALETVNPKMQATLDAAYISKMSQRGQIPGVIADGPLALDNALFAEAARTKGIDSPVAGDADILLVPFIECGNVLYKSLTLLAGINAAGVICGAAAPVVLTSRADDMRLKLNSIALGAAAAVRGYGKTRS